MPDDTMGNRCPTCGGAFELESQGRIEVDRCAACGAVWFDRTELAAFARYRAAGTVGRGRRITALEQVGGPHRCPRCREASLHPYEWGDFRFLRCSGCEGVHVTREELEGFLGNTSEWAERLEREQRSELERASAVLDFVAQILTRLFHR